MATHGCFDRELAEASADRSLSDLFDRPANERTERELLDPEALTGLVLAGANRPIDADQDDGRLTDLEISTLDLRNVDLAVLSACDTATGRLSAGDGVLGLQRAFHIAGAKTVVASLWQVDDLSTRELMTEFYHNLWTQHSDKPVSKLHALTDAQRTLLRHYDPKSQTVRRRAKVADSPTDTRVAPYHWAAFILSGDWR